MKRKQKWGLFMVAWPSPRCDVPDGVIAQSSAYTWEMPLSDALEIALHYGDHGYQPCLLPDDKAEE